MAADSSSKNTKQRVYIPGKSRDLKSGEVLSYDKSAYRMLFPFQTEYPCLSLDPVADADGDGRQAYPLHCSLVAGTQADAKRKNAILFLRLSNLRGKTEGASDDGESSDESADEQEEAAGKPILCCASIPHHGGVNRIRAAQLGAAPVCAVWNDCAFVQIWNLTAAMAGAAQAAEDASERVVTLKSEQPLFTFRGHQAEGFAVDWSRPVVGRLASGDTRGRVHVWSMGEGGQWAVDERPLDGHTRAVEDLQWSTVEPDLLVSCSSDRSLRVWDVRSPPASACVCRVADAHGADVNVISLSADGRFLLSGGDDGVVKVWDLKLIQTGKPAAVFKYHTEAITAVQWSPLDDTVFAVSSEDDQTTIWDLSVERDDAAEPDEDADAVPPQLLFVHMGQKEVKDVRWHPQLTGTLVTTALDGFNLFRTISA